MQSTDDPQQPISRQSGMAWLALVAVIAVLANGMAVMVMRHTFGPMGGVSEFAAAVRAQDIWAGRLFNCCAFPLMTVAAIWYMRPLLTHVRRGGETPSLQAQRRLVGIPLVVALLGFLPWFIGCLFFPLLTVYRFGRWSPELTSQQLLSPLVSGFLAATTTYLLLDWLVRSRIVPRLLPTVRLAEVPGALALGVSARLIVFLVAVAFTPLFTMLGLVRAAVVRLDHGIPVEKVMPVLADASNWAFAAYVLLGIGLTVVLARTLTRPLREVVDELRRVQGGDLRGTVRVTSSDELGVLQEGVNGMLTALREKEHILQTFGRVVEPAIRDQLLSGGLRLGGELRSASVLFCDLRGFTAFAERTPPEDVVATLNQFFTTMTSCVRECGGFVDKFIGDAMLVVFGLFDRGPEDGVAHSAAAAVRCALGIRERLTTLNASRAAVGQPPLQVAVSIHTGDVVSGTIGAADRHEYTVIGDTVNVAARLQQLCKEQGCDLLFSEATYELARTQGLCRDAMQRDAVSLRGRQQPVRVFGIA